MGWMSWDGCFDDSFTTMDGLSIVGRCCVLGGDIEWLHGCGPAASFNSMEIIMSRLLLVGVALTALFGFASGANASSLMTDRDRLDGSQGCVTTQSVVVDAFNRSATEPRDPYTEGA